MTEDKRIASVKKWVDDIVIGHNFCPFAKFVRSPDTIRYAVCEASKPKSVLAFLAKECELLASDASISTTLIVLSRGFESFYTYLDVLDKANDLLDVLDYRGQFQLASFHPDYVFDGEPEDAPSHFTNRAPLPLFHLIRESDIDRALKEYKDPESIPINNVALAERKGCEHFEAILADCTRILKE